MNNKWSARYLADLGERVAATFIASLIAMITADASGAITGNAEQWWLLVGLPTLLTLLKGLAANLANPASGASVLPAPTGPDVVGPTP